MLCTLLLCVEVSAGMGHANAQNCGIWYTCDAGSPYHLHQDAATYSLGAALPEWRAGLQRLGNTETDAYVSLPADGGPAYYTVVGKTRGVYLEKVWRHGPMSVEAGLWLYRASVHTAANGAIYSSAANGVGPMLGASYRSGKATFAYSIRGTESRAIDWNGNHQPSPTKGFTQTAEVRFTF